MTLAVSLTFCAGWLVALPRASRASSPGCVGAYLRPNGTNAAAIGAATLCLIDQVRASRGLRTLRPNPALRGVAAGQAYGMLRWNYFADVRPSGQTPMGLVSGTAYRRHAAHLAVGQNIAWGTGSFATPAHIVAEWMASPPHRQIMLTSVYRDAGVGVTAALPSVLRAGSHGSVYVVEFGARRR